MCVELQRRTPDNISFDLTSDDYGPCLLFRTSFFIARAYLRGWARVSAVRENVRAPCYGSGLTNTYPLLYCVALVDNPELRGLETIVEKEKHERTAQHYPNVLFVVKYDADRVDLRRASAQTR